MTVSPSSSEVAAGAIIMLLSPPSWMKTWHWATDRGRERNESKITHDSYKRILNRENKADNSHGDHWWGASPCNILLPTARLQWQHIYHMQYKKEGWLISSPGLWCNQTELQRKRNVGEAKWNTVCDDVMSLLGLICVVQLTARFEWAHSII